MTPHTTTGHASDPPGMPEDERMTAAELRVILEWLALPHDWLAGHLGLQDRTVRRWVAGTTPVPDFARLAIEAIEDDTARAVTAGIDQLNDAVDPAVVTYPSDEAYRAAHPEALYPAAWHRRVVARIAQEVPGLVIDWWRP